MHYLTRANPIDPFGPGVTNLDYNTGKNSTWNLLNGYGAEFKQKCNEKIFEYIKSEILSYPSFKEFSYRLAHLCGILADVLKMKDPEITQAVIRVKDNSVGLVWEGARKRAYIPYMDRIMAKLK